VNRLPSEGGENGGKKGREALSRRHLRRERGEAVPLPEKRLKTWEERRRVYHRVTKRGRGCGKGGAIVARSEKKRGKNKRPCRATPAEKKKTVHLRLVSLGKKIKPKKKGGNSVVPERGEEGGKRRDA